jgi:hypothetical protein
MGKSKIYSPHDYDMESYFGAEDGEDEKKHVARIKKMMEESSKASPSYIDSAKKLVIPVSTLGGLAGMAISKKPIKGGVIGLAIGAASGAGLSGIDYKNKKDNVRLAKNMLSDKNIDKKIIEKLHDYKKQLKDVPVTEVYYKD